MKKAKKNIEIIEDELLPEYNIDYTQVKRNPYFKNNRVFIEVDEEVANVFQNSENINIKVPDAIIAATAIENNFTLISRNVNDFNRIVGLKNMNPFE